MSGFVSTGDNGTVGSCIVEERTSMAAVDERLLAATSRYDVGE